MLNAFLCLRQKKQDFMYKLHIYRKAQSKRISTDEQETTNPTLQELTQVQHEEDTGTKNKHYK